MLGDQAFEPPLHCLRQGIVSGARVGKFRIAAGGRHRFGMQHRPGGRLAPEGAVGMPEFVPPHERRARVVLTEDSAALVKIGDVEYFTVLYARIRWDLSGFSPNAGRHLKRPVAPRKGDLLL